MKRASDWFLGAFLVFFSALPLSAQTVGSPWIDHDGRAQSRLVVAQHEDRFVAFVEILMPEGWKTYWRNPGDAGGLPPSFDFTKSENVAATRVLYPAPKRLSDRAGDTIGYKGRALFPVEIDAAAIGKPVILRLHATFGVCREICVPLEASHEVKVEDGLVGAAEGALLDALQGVPVALADAKPGAPKLVRASVESYEDPAQISFAVTVGEGTDADIFVEAPDGLYVPMPKRAEGSADGGALMFHAKVASAAELKQLLGKQLKVTVVSSKGQTESIVTLK